MRERERKKERECVCMGGGCCLHAYPSRVERFLEEEREGDFCATAQAHLSEAK